MDSLRDFLGTIDAAESLSKLELSRLCRRAQKGDQAARDQLWRSHLRLIIYVAKRFYRAGGFFEWGDLIQQGSLGLLRAVERYDMSKRPRRRRLAFPWYATYWIAHGIRRDLHNLGRTVRLPVYLQQELSRWKQELQGMRSCLRKRSNPELRRLASAEQTYHPLEESSSEGDETQGRSSVLGLGSWDLCEQALIRREVGKAVRQMVDALPPREGEVVQKNFGFNALEGTSQKPLPEGITCLAIAQEMGVSPQRVQILRRSAIRRLRRAVRFWPELT